jgi:hypothetical protein
VFSHTKPTPFRIATFGCPIATQLQHINSKLQIFNKFSMNGHLCAIGCHLVVIISTFVSIICHDVAIAR